jgi:uncharacterized protein YoxC
MNDFGIISLIMGIAFLIFAIFVKPTKHKPKHEQ